MKNKTAAQRQLIGTERSWPDQTPRISYCQTVGDDLRNVLNRVVSFGYTARQVSSVRDTIN